MDRGRALSPEFPQAETLALLGWLNASALDSIDELVEQAQRERAQIQRRLGGQLIAIHWGARQGAQSLPWTAKTWLEAHYAQLLRLGDRFYGAWGGQADFEKLGVSCERSFTLATSIPVC